MIAKPKRPANAALPIRSRAATTALFLANGFGIGLWAASIPPISDGLGLSDAKLGLALLAFAVGAMLTMPVTGYLISRFGSARVAFLTALAFAAALVFPALMPGFVSLTVAILVLGACNGAMDVAMNGHGTIVERAWGRPIMSSLHAAFSLGGLLGAASGGLLLSRGLGAIGCLGAGSATAFILVLAAASSLRVTTAVAQIARPIMGFAWPSRSVLQVGALAFLCMFVEGAITDWAGKYLVAAAGASTAAAVSGFSGFAFAMTIGRLFGDRVVHRLGGPRTVALGAGLATIGLSLTLLFPRIDIAIIGYAMAGTGIANIIPVVFSTAGRRARGHPGMGVAGAATCGYAGFLISPPLIGVIASAVGLRWALIVLVLGILTIALFAPIALAHDRDSKLEQ